MVTIGRAIPATLLMIGLFLAQPGGVAAQGRLLAYEHPKQLGWLDAKGKLRSLKLPFAISGVHTRLLLNDPRHLLLVDRGVKPGERRLAVLPLDGGKPWALPIPRPKRRSRLIQLVRYLPASKQLVFTAMDHYRSGYFLLDVKGKRRALPTLRRYKRKFFERHVLPSGRVALLYAPAFNARTERAGSANYKSRNPKVRQTLYLGDLGGKTLRKVLTSRDIEGFWLRRAGSELLVLLAGRVDAAAGKKSYHLAALRLAGTRGEVKPRRITTLWVSLRRGNTVPPELHVFQTVPYVLVARKRGKPGRTMTLIDLRSGKRRPFALPVHDRVLEPIPSRTLELNALTRRYPYVITQKWQRMIARGRYQYVYKVVEVPSGKVVRTINYVGRGLKKAVYLPGDGR